jgi:hypothetical protein
MDKENIAYIHNGILFIHNEEIIPVIFNKMDGTGGYSFFRKIFSHFLFFNF